MACRCWPVRWPPAPSEARAAAERIGGPVVVKAQVLVGGRGKAGGVKLAASPDEAEQRAREIIGLDIKGVRVQTVLVAPAADIAQGVLPGADPGPRRQGGDHHRQRRGRGRDRGDGPHQPGSDPAAADRPAAGPAGPQRAARRLLPGHCRPSCGRRSHRSCAGCTTPSWEPMPTWPRSTRWSITERGRAAGAGRQDRARRLRPVPPCRPGGDARPERGGALRDRGARGGHQLRQAGRQTSAAWSTAPGWR